MFLASPITFPNLGIEINPSPVAFTAFGKDIYWYGIIIAAGFLLAVFYMLSRAKDFGITQDDVLDMILWTVPIGVICARLEAGVIGSVKSCTGTWCRLVVALPGKRGDVDGYIRQNRLWGVYPNERVE